MAADSSMGFQQGIIPSFYNQHMVSFQSGAINSNSRGMNNSHNSNAGMYFSPNSSNLVNNISIMNQAGSSSHDSFGSVPKFKFVTGSPADWSLSELAVLKEGLVRYAHEPTIMKYIKIAAMLPTKTIRDVALRCWWNTSKESSKRRKPEDHYTGKKMRDMKEKMMAPTSNANIISSDEMPLYSLLMNPSSQNCSFANEGPVIDSATQHLIEENNTILSQIAANMETFKLQENPNLFVQTSNNIMTILNRMSDTPGIMCRMPPLPVSMNEENLNSVFQLDRMISYGGQSVSHMKQEPRS
ncbi:hypothetical protein LUZ60_012030 [Juncus effusus]|nr:hypothetical protein LUZ60_012030 [Juncus effusus]